MSSVGDLNNGVEQVKNGFNTTEQALVATRSANDNVTMTLGAMLIHLRKAAEAGLSPAVDALGESISATNAATKNARAELQGVSLGSGNGLLGEANNLSTILGFNWAADGSSARHMRVLGSRVNRIMRELHALLATVEDTGATTARFSERVDTSIDMVHRVQSNVTDYQAGH